MNDEYLRASADSPLKEGEIQIKNYNPGYKKKSDSTIKKINPGIQQTSDIQYKLSEFNLLEPDEDEDDSGPINITIYPGSQKGTAKFAQDSGMQTAHFKRSSSQSQDEAGMDSRSSSGNKINRSIYSTITNDSIAPQLEQHQLNFNNSQVFVYPKANAPNSININMQQLAYEYKKALSSVLRKMNVKKEDIADAVMMQQTNLLKTSDDQRILDLQSFRALPSSWETRLLNTKFGTKSIKPSLTNLNNTHYFVQHNGLLQLNHGLLFGYISLFNMTQAPIQPVYNTILSMQQDPFTIPSAKINEINQTLHVNYASAVIYAQSKGILEHCIYYQKLFAPIPIKQFHLECSNSYKWIEDNIISMIFRELKINIISDDSDWKFYDYVVQLVLRGVQLSDKDTLRVYPDLRLTISDLLKTQQSDVRQRRNTNIQRMIKQCKQYAELLKVFVAYRTILDVLVLTNLNDRDPDESLIDLYQGFIHSDHSQLLDHLPFHKFCVFPGQHHMFQQLLQDMKPYSIVQSDYKLVEPMPSAEETQERTQVLQKLMQYVRNCINIVQDQAAIDKTPEYQCFLHSMDIYATRNNQILAYNQQHAEYVIAAKQQNISFAQKDYILPNGIYPIEDPHKIVKRPYKYFACDLFQSDDFETRGFDSQHIEAVLSKYYNNLEDEDVTNDRDSLNVWHYYTTHLGGDILGNRNRVLQFMISHASLIVFATTQFMDISNAKIDNKPVFHNGNLIAIPFVNIDWIIQSTLKPQIQLPELICLDLLFNVNVDHQLASVGFDNVQKNNYYETVIDGLKRDLQKYDGVLKSLKNYSYYTFKLQQYAKVANMMASAVKSKADNSIPNNQQLRVELRPRENVNDIFLQTFFNRGQFVNYNDTQSDINFISIAFQKFKQFMASLKYIDDFVITNIEHPDDLQACQHAQITAYNKDNTFTVYQFKIQTGIPKTDLMKNLYTLSTQYKKLAQIQEIDRPRAAFSTLLNNNLLNSQIRECLSYNKSLVFDQDLQKQLQRLQQQKRQIINDYAQQKALKIFPMLSDVIYNHKTKSFEPLIFQIIKTPVILPLLHYSHTVDIMLQCGIPVVFNGDFVEIHVLQQNGIYILEKYLREYHNISNGNITQFNQAVEGLTDNYQILMEQLVNNILVIAAFANIKNSELCNYYLLATQHFIEKPIVILHKSNFIISKNAPFEIESKNQADIIYIEQLSGHISRLL